MARYIDTSKVHIPKGFFNDLNVPKLFDWLNSQPTSDVVEVVRCKDCIYANDKGDTCHFGEGRFVKPDHYCGYGENNV